MNIDLFELIPVTRNERFMYAIIERLDKIIKDKNNTDNPILETVKEQTKKKTTRKKKVEVKKDE